MQVLRSGKSLGMVLILGGLVLSGWCAAQDTNFATGPQYLVNYGSPLFLHSIETPTLSLSAPPAANPSASAEQGTGEPSSPAVGGFKSEGTVDRIYWGASAISANASEAPAAESGTAPAEVATAVQSSEIEVSSTEPSRPLPASFVEVGVAAVIDAQNRYGTPLGEVAAYLKANKPQVSRVFTNADVARLHGN